MSPSSHLALLAADAVSSHYRFEPVGLLLALAHLSVSHSAASTSATTQLQYYSSKIGIIQLLHYLCKKYEHIFPFAIHLQYFN